MNKPALLMDASAMTELVCARRFQFRVAYGMDIDNDDLRFGSAFHTWVEKRDRNEPVDAVELATTLKVDAAKLLLCTEAFNLLMPRNDSLLDANGEPLIEWKVSFPYKVLPDVDVYLQATIDRIDVINGSLRVLDYKTTANARPETMLNDYALRLQVYFYLWLMHKYGYKFLPDALAELITNNQTFGQICVIAKNTLPVKISYSTPFGLSSDMHFEVENLLDDAIDKARIVLKSKEILYREGFVYGVCKNCPYNVICITNDTERQLNYINNWPRKAYNPMEFR